MNKIYMPPEPIPSSISNGIFLAGSIEMDKVELWQTNIATKLATHYAPIFNPRRTHRDNTIVQSSDDAQFAEQVDWELDALDQAEIILMYLDPNTKSPISLLELGLYATSKKMLVFCPMGFWRRGNVEMVCHKYDIPLYLNAITALHTRDLIRCIEKVWRQIV